MEGRRNIQESLFVEKESRRGGCGGTSDDDNCPFKIPRLEFHETISFMEVTLFMKGIEIHPKELTEVVIEELSVRVRVKNLNNEHYFMNIPLHDKIIAKKSEFRIVKDRIIFHLVKAKPVVWNSLFYTPPSVIDEFKEKLLPILTPLTNKIPHSKILKQPTEAVFRHCRIESEMSYYNVGYLRGFIEYIPDLTLPTSVRSDEEVVEFLKTDLPNRGHNVDDYIEFLSFALFLQVNEKFSKTHPESVHKTKKKSNLEADDRKPYKKNIEAELLKEKGNSFFQAKRFRCAIEAYTQAMALDPHCPSYCLNRALAYLQLKDDVNAEHDFLLALKIDPFSIKVRLHLGKMLCDLYAFELAKYHFYFASCLDWPNEKAGKELANLKKCEDWFSNIFEDPNKIRTAVDIMHKVCITSQNIEPLMKLISIGSVDYAKRCFKLLLSIYGGNLLIKRTGTFILELCAIAEGIEDEVHESLEKIKRFAPYFKPYERIKEIYDCKKAGDAALADRLFKKATEFYTVGLEICMNLESYFPPLFPNTFSKLYCNRAKALMHMGKRLEALSSASSAIDIDNKNHEALALRAELFLRDGKLKAAEEQLQKALNISQCNIYKQSLQKILANGKKEIGNQSFEDGHYHEAIELYSEAIALDPTNALFYSNRSACHLALKNFKGGLKDSESALKIDPSSLKALVRLSRCQIALGRPIEAVQSLEKALKLHSKSFCVKSEMERAKKLEKVISDGESCLLQKDYANADRHFSFALTLEERCLYFHIKKIECLFHLEKYDEALCKIKTAFKADPQNPTLYYFKGLCCYQKGQEKESVVLLEKSISIDPTQARVSEALKKIQIVFNFRNLGNEAFSKNKLKEALSHYSEGLKEDSTNKVINTQLHFKIGLIHKKNGALKEAIDSFSVVISFKIDHTKAYQNRAHCYSKLNKWAEAAGDYEVLLKMSPCPKHEKWFKAAKKAVGSTFSSTTWKDKKITLADNKNKQGDKHFTDKNYKDAFICYSEAISLNPGCVSYYIRCCECYVAMGSHLDSLKESKEPTSVYTNSFEGYTRVGKSYILLGNVDEAIAAFEKARKHDPKEEIVNKIVNAGRLKKFKENGDEELGNKKFDRALVHFKRASEIAIWDSSVLLKKAECLFHLQKWKDLKDLVGSVPDELKNYSDVFCMKGILSYFEDNKEKALKYMKDAFEADPSNRKSKDWQMWVQTVYSFKERGNRAFRNEDYMNALILYQTALKHDPGSTIVQSKLNFNIGVVQMKQKYFSNAINSFTKAITLRKDYIKALERRAECYRKARNLEESIKDYQKLHDLTSCESHLKTLQDVQKELEGSSSKDYYVVLGVSRDASMEDIRKSYKRLALEFHPDRMRSEEDKVIGEKKFKEISVAYSVLSDPLRRERYDNGETEATLGFQTNPFGSYYSDFAHFLFMRMFQRNYSYYDDYY